MSMYYRDNREVYVPEYDDGRTEGAFLDQCDINKIIKKHQIANAASHAAQYPPECYAEFDGVDLLGAYERDERARALFDDLPSEIRNEFSNDHRAFVTFMAQPDNEARHAQVLKALAEPGAYFPNPAQRGGQGAAAATAPQTAPVAPQAPLSAGNGEPQASQSSQEGGSSEPSASSST